MTGPNPRDFLRGLFDAAVAAADPQRTLPLHLPDPPMGRTLVLAAGKAAASMAKAVEGSWKGPFSGIAVTRYGHGLPCDNIEIIEAGHPLPDDAGVAAAKRFLKSASALTEDDLLLFLVSGGASALLVEPAPGLALAEKQAISRVLLKSGVPIDEMNCLRKHLSAIKGGRLAAAAHPAKVVTLGISDVPGDDPAVIGSGPTVGDFTSCEDAIAIAKRRGIDLPPHVLAALTSEEWESVPPNDPRLENVEYRLIARPLNSQSAAADHANALGISASLMGADLEGEARHLGQGHAALALRSGPGVLLSGGETTVTVNGKGGRGGRNCEYLLAMAIALDGVPGIHAIACDTDGIDGTEDAAGAVITPTTLNRAAKAGLDAQMMLDGHDSYSFFAELGDLIITGPTRTNVNDFRAILIVGGECRPPVL
ncbi:MAG: glycerate kinase [Pseudomonadota bacterium]|nr:glycerate kinase [Pseudomonadota bacterium]